MDGSSRRCFPCPLRSRTRGEAARRHDAKVSLLGDGFTSKDSEIKDGYPEFTLGVLKKLGWDKDLTEAEMAVINKVNPTTPDAVSWSTRPLGRHPARRDRARLHPVRQRQGADECLRLAGCRSRSIASRSIRRGRTWSRKYPTLPDAKQFRVPNIGFTVQKAAVDKGIAKQFPLILSSGRLVEYEGGGEETRSNKWLAELQQDMFIEINPADAADRGIRDGGWVWVTGAESKLQGRR